MEKTVLPVNRGYLPLASASLFGGDGYREIPPCPELAPFVRCFWEMDDFRESPASTIIPDTCADVIFERAPGEADIRASFCGVNDAPLFVQNAGKGVRLYAIRFYAWAAAIFSGESLERSVNAYCPAEEFFSGLVRGLTPVLRDTPSLWIPAAEGLLCQALEVRPLNARMMNSVYKVLERGGRVSLEDMASESVWSGRQLQRVFLKETGLSPKRFAQLVRYQSLWRAALSPGFRVLDAVERFGYTDQSHLLREFKRFHGIPLTQARRLALGDVAFLQDLPPDL